MNKELLDIISVIEKKYVEIWLVTPENERIVLGLNMMEEGMQATKKFLQDKYPEKNAAEIKFEALKEWYGKDLTGFQLENIEKMLL